jgi:amidase
MTKHDLTDDFVVAAAARLGVELSSSDLRTVTRCVRSALQAYEQVDRLYERIAPAAPSRPWRVPEPDQNPLGAWAVTCDLRTVQDGPLAGVTVAVKDSISVAGVPMSVGSAVMSGFVPATDATVVSRLLDAGAVIRGKAVCEDLCFSGSSFTSASGSVRNPWAPTREAGGSSSGSAALLAAGAVDLALGGDQGGSIRIPAAHCGVVGLKPTYGLVPYTGCFPFERTLDHVGPMARTVRDTARMLEVLAGSDGHDPRQHPGLPAGGYLRGLDDGAQGLRVGVVREGFGHDGLSEPGVDALVRDVAHRMGDLGCVVEDVSVPWHHHAFDVWKVVANDGGTYQMVLGNAYGLNAAGLYDPELIAYYGDRLRTQAAATTDLMTVLGVCGIYGLEQLHSSTHAKARNLAPLARAAYDSALEAYDVLVMPTVPFIAAELPGPDTTTAERIALATAASRNCAPFNLTGHPALSVPVGVDRGMPVGMMLVGRHLDEATLLRVAADIEDRLGFTSRA